MVNDVLLSEEQEQKDTSRFEELKKVETPNEDEKKELSEIQDRYSKRVQARIDKLTSKAKEAEERFGKADERAKQLEEELQALKAEPKDPITPISKETLKIGDKVFYTDRALNSMVLNKEITEEEAYKHKDERLEEAAADKAYKRLKNEQTEIEKKNQLAEDTRFVFNKYPHWNSKHPEFNPNDKIYKKANEYFLKGMSLKDSMEEAEKFIGDIPAPDNTNNLNVHSPSAPGDHKGQPKEVPLSEEEKESAIRFYTMGGAVNPKTNRPYTKDEAIAKATKAKNERAKSRRIL